jgi:hypothetical protein
MADAGHEPEGQHEQLDLSARGGVGTLHGVDYQVRVAVHLALRLIKHQLEAPHLRFAITVEPMVLAGGKTEKWDISTEPPDEVFEAKVTPTAADLKGFLTDVASSQLATRHLVYGEKSSAVKHLINVVKLRDGAGGDPDRFAKMLNGAPRILRDFAKPLGDDAYDAAGRIRTENLADDFVDSHIMDQAAALCGDGGEALVDRLVNRFLGQAKKRVRHGVREMIGEARDRGVVFMTSAANADMSAAERAMVFVLDEVAMPVPATVLAGAAGTNAAAVPEQLSRMLEADVVGCDDGMWTIDELIAPVSPAEPASVLSGALRAALAWVREHRYARQTAGVVDVIVKLSELVGDTDPEAVACVFQVIDKELKARCSRKQVYEIAKRSIDAAKIATRSNEIVQAESIALICGRSWVLQRVDQVAVARLDGERSLELAESIGDVRTVAFCHKCLGRMCRLEAERAEGDDQRGLLLALSVDHLTQAIARFTDLRDEPEIGDGYSLIARTRLVAGDVAGCEQAISEAEPRLTDPKNKDYQDLRLVRADLAAATGDLVGARSLYAEVIESFAADQPDHEIRGRAFHGRGRLDDSSPQDAVADLMAATDIFARLGEYERSARSEIVVMRLQGRLPTREQDASIAQLLESEPQSVQVRAVKRHEERENSGRYEAAVAFRKRAALPHWKTIVDEARAEVARLGRFW